MEDIIYWVWLSILNLRPIEKIKLLEILKTPKDIYKLEKQDIEKITNSYELIKIIKGENKVEEAISIVNQSIKNDIKIINIQASEYPDRLRRIYDPPIILYAKGDIKLLKSFKTVAIVGTRNCSNYGRVITERFAQNLSRLDYTIVSGMAIGVDSKAHITAITNKGKTIAVLGSGIEYIYPKENIGLYRSIIENGGLIVSEYPLHTRPMPYFFPMRNRIISGLADKVLITEAGRNSGSLITANFAIDQGKNVYAVPGDITNINSTGTNELLKDGAILTTSLEDILNL